MQVQTVRGAISAAELGIVLPHEHLCIDRYAVTGDYNKRLDDDALIAQELMAFRDLGGSTVFELTPANAGRQPERLARIALESGINIVMGCGWYLENYATPDVHRTSTAALAEQLTTEITEGVEGTSIRPGIIGEIATGSFISPVEERTLRAAGRASCVTGLPISTHAFASRVAQDQIALLREEGVDPSRVVVGHQDSVPDSDFHESLLRQGVWLQFDLIRAENQWEIQRRVDLIREVFRRGYGHRLLISQDVCMKSHLRAYGGGGYTAIFEQLFPALETAGITADDYLPLVTENPRKLFTMGSESN